MIELKLRIVRVAREGLLLQDKMDDGSMPCGHNGPYNDPETAVRNTAHWLITFAKAFEISHDIVFKQAVDKCAQYLASPEARPHNKTFFHRSKDGKDACNGLIGQAWTIEALAVAGALLSKTSYVDLAVEVFEMHPFDEKKKLWKRVEPDGEVLGFDTTFNHQLWFCMSGSLILGASSEVERKVLSFVEGLPISLDLKANGRIGQGLYLNFKDSRLKPLIKKVIRPVETRYMLLKEVGYHAFNTYAFALLYNALPQLDFWRSKRFEKIINYLLSDEYKLLIQESKYGFKYNPPGFEVLFTQQVFKSNGLVLDTAYGEQLFDQQVKQGFLDEEGLMIKNCFDPETHAARFYEAVRIHG